MTNPGRLNLAAMWGEIQRGVSERLSTAELWGIVRDAAQARGFEGVSGGLSQMNALRSTAAAIRDAAGRFNRADMSALITPEYFAPDINAQSITGRSLTPVYRARFVQTVRTVSGESVATHRTVSFPFQLPPTKSMLIEELNLNAQAMAETYGEEHEGIGEIEITVV